MRITDGATATARHIGRLYYTINGVAGYFKQASFVTYSNGVVLVDQEGKSSEFKTTPQARAIARKLVGLGYKFY